MDISEDLPNLYWVVQSYACQLTIVNIHHQFSPHLHHPQHRPLNSDLHNAIPQLLADLVSVYLQCSFGIVNIIELCEA